MKPIGIKDKDGPLSLAGKYQVSYSKSSNAISEEGNTIFYNMIKKYINEWKVIEKKLSNLTSIDV